MELLPAHSIVSRLMFIAIFSFYHFLIDHFDCVSPQSSFMIIVFMVLEVQELGSWSYMNYNSLFRRNCSYAILRKHQRSSARCKLVKFEDSRCIDEVRLANIFWRLCFCTCLSLLEIEVVTEIYWILSLESDFVLIDFYRYAYPV